MATEQLVTLRLGGMLGRKFGAEHQFYLSKPSPAEMVRAMDANTKGEFRRYLAGHDGKRYYKVALGRKDNLLGKDELAHPTGQSDIYILPAVKGANSGVGKIIAGVALAVLTYGASAWASAAGYAASTVTAIGTVGYGMAASLVLGGITQLLTPTPNFNQSSEDSRGSNVFGGNAVAVSQGASIGLVYGRALVAPMPISLSFTTADQTIANSFAPQGYTIVYGPDGIVEYVPNDTNAQDNLP